MSAWSRGAIVALALAFLGGAAAWAREVERDLERARADFDRAVARADRELADGVRAFLRETFDVAVRRLVDPSGPPAAVDGLIGLTRSLALETAEVSLWFGDEARARQDLEASVERLEGTRSGLEVERFLRDLDLIGSEVGAIPGSVLSGPAIAPGGIQALLFWTPSDDRSVGELGRFSRLARALRGEPRFQPIGVVVNEPWRESLVSGTGGPLLEGWPQVWDRLGWDSPLVRKLGLHRRGVPMTLLVDGRGRIVRPALWGNHGLRWIRRELARTGR